MYLSKPGNTEATYSNDFICKTMLPFLLIPLNGLGLIVIGLRLLLKLNKNTYTSIRI